MDFETRQRAVNTSVGRFIRRSAIPVFVGWNCPDVFAMPASERGRYWAEVDNDFLQNWEFERLL